MMEHRSGQDPGISGIVETLTSMFGNLISQEVIFAVVESCEGDLNLAAEIVMNMSSDADIQLPGAESTSETQHNTTPEHNIESQNTPNQNLPHPSPNIPNTQANLTPQLDQDLLLPSLNIPNTQTNLIAQMYNQPTMSYAGASRNTGAVPKQPTKPRAIVWTEQVRQIVTHHNQGLKLLIFMRGAPGSGKSYLARQIVEITIGSKYDKHIFSTDDYFMVRGSYQYDKSQLSQAHDWNHNRVRLALRQGLTPVIVDNTNVEIWEMEPYLREGVKNGYIIEVVEPNTPWARKPNQLIRKSTHNVPQATIRRMLDNFQHGITGEYLIKSYGLQYPANMVPSAFKTTPARIPLETSFPLSPIITTENNSTVNIAITIDPPAIESMEPPQASNNTQPPRKETDLLSNLGAVGPEIETQQEENVRQKRYLEIQKQIEEIEKVEEEWENGESWGEEIQGTVTSEVNNAGHGAPLPQRGTESEGSTPKKNVLETVASCEDWSQLDIFMPPWTNQSSTSASFPIEIPVRETKCSSTIMETGDTDLKNPKMLKIIVGSPKDINLFYLPTKIEKIPQNRMLDKSTMTNELLITEAYRCKNEEHHFIAFRKLFKNIPKVALRDIFDKCCGDVNWAVDIVLGGIAENQLAIIEGEDISDNDEELHDPCNCLAAYNIVPDTNITQTNSADNIDVKVEEIPLSPTKIILPQKKNKIALSDSAKQMKREMERNFVISDNHYSNHTLMIKKWRHGELPDENSELTISTEGASNVVDVASHPEPSTSKEHVGEIIDQTAEVDANSKDDDEISNASSMEDVERTVNVNLGTEFVNELDDLFGRRGMQYPKSIMPRINIPISLLNEINAFWMESLMCQLDELDKQNTKMLKEDEDFARQLAMKEAELAQQGKEPEVPDFKEIMDMDFAISLYQKDVAEWRNKEPKDIAAKMSRDKLFNLFPDMCPDILAELLMAHENNFQATVEVLLMSTGRAEILAHKNGLNKFLMEKEMERQEKLLEEEKKALAEVEWPLLPKGQKVDLSVVNEYREQADKHLNRRNMNYQKAQDYIRRGMTQVANYYSDIASFHKQKYEQANSLAAASLMQVHANNSPDNATIDLHYLRVGEARESLDLFLDSHIHKLRETSNPGVKYHTLFFITGRGLHSSGGPRVKPAVKRRLRERGLAFSERNPGLLTAKVSAEDKLSHQVIVP